jgi:hypothetical protein
MAVHPRSSLSLSLFILTFPRGCLNPSLILRENTVISKTSGWPRLSVGFTFVSSIVFSRWALVRTRRKHSRGLSTLPRTNVIMYSKFRKCD